MVRGDLAGDVLHPARLGLPHELDGARCARVRYVQTAAGQLRERDVPGDHDLLGGARDALYAQQARHPALVGQPLPAQLGDLAVVDDRQAERRAVGQRLPHDVRVVDGEAVVAEADDAGLRELAHLGELRPKAALGDAADGQDADRALVTPLAQHEVDHRAGVDHRVGVGHGAHRGEAAPGRGPRAGGDRLLVLEAGLPQVAVQVDESGAYDQPGSVQDLGVFLLYAFLDAENLAVLDDHVGDPVDSP